MDRSFIYVGYKSTILNWGQDDLLHLNYPRENLKEEGSKRMSYLSSIDLAPSNCGISIHIITSMLNVKNCCFSFLIVGESL